MITPPAPRPDSVLTRALLRIRTAWWHSRCLAQGYRRDTKTAVTRRLRRPRPLTIGGWPTSRHPDHLKAPVLGETSKRWLAEADAEVTAALPVGLRVALTCESRRQS